MDSATLECYRKIVEGVLSRYAKIFPINVDVENEPIFDRERDRYILVSHGWEKKQPKRLHGSLIHIDIKDGKIWIQNDNTQDGVAYELMEAGIPKENIVLGFRRPEVRQYTEFAAA